MRISVEEARRIASLARLELDDAALERLAGEMTAILDYVDQLQSVDTPAGETGGSSVPLALRPDAIAATLDRESAERNAPSWRDGFFVVPRVIGE